MASEPQALDTIPLIRRKRGGEADQELPEVGPVPIVQAPAPEPLAVAEHTQSQETADVGALRMKPRETVQLAAVHVRIPEQLARGLRLMSVLENEQAQVIVAKAIEDKLNSWNPKWRDTVNPRV